MEQRSTDRVLIVGAGVAGLSLGRRLHELGREVALLERARGVGGRCASWTLEGRRVDPGVPMLHGAASLFLEALQRLPGCSAVRDWPFHVRGSGTPCQPQAFRPRSQRLAIVEGISCFAKQLAQGQQVELATEVQRLRLEGEELCLDTNCGERRARTVVLTLPVEETQALLDGLADGWPELRGVQQTLRTCATVPCLTVVAIYPEVDPLDFHLLLPGGGSPIHSLINDSAKRPGRGTVLVIQAQPGFSRERLEAEETIWTEELLAAAAELLGAWAERPAARRAHRWRHARLLRGSELAHPALLSWPSGARLGLCGEAFNRAGGVEGAFLSGLELAARLASDAATCVEPSPAGQEG
jgi:renalase